MPEQEVLVKIVIDTLLEDDGVGGEGLWAKSQGDDLYELENSPFHTIAVNYRDVVRAVAPSVKDKPVFVEVVRRGGHRTIHTIFLPEGMPYRDEVLLHVNSLGATWEGEKGSFFAIDIPPDASFDEVADYLESRQHLGWVESRYAPQPQPPGSADLLA